MATHLKIPLAITIWVAYWLPGDSRNEGHRPVLACRLGFEGRGSRRRRGNPAGCPCVAGPAELVAPALRFFSFLPSFEVLLLLQFRWRTSV